VKLLYITSRVPWPLEKGDKLRAYHQLRLLAEQHEIYLAALHDQPLHPQADKELRRFCKEILYLPLPKRAVAFNLLRGTFSGLPFQVAYFYSKSAQEKLDRFIAQHRPERIFCQLIRTSEYARGHEDIPKVIDYMDVFSKGVERRLGKVSPLLRPVFRTEYKRLVRYEHDVFSRFDERIIISGQDRDLIPHPERGKIHVVANGVDTDFFHPRETKKTYELLFNGNMNYPPNVESAEYLVQKILPLVHEKKPGVRVLISGASPAPRVLALRSEKVTVSGWVEDVRDSFAQSRLLVAPMQSSIGLQNKLLEAMAMQLPCITTSLSNNALKAEAGRQVLVADTPEAFAQHILHLLDHPEEAERIAHEGYRFALENFNWNTIAQELGKIIVHAGEKK